MEYVVSVDVGTNEVRASVVDKLGKVTKVYREPIKMWNPQPNYYQQSSKNIWTACCKATKSAVSNLKKGEIKGIGFDATCSLVVLDANGKPLPVYSKGDPEQNVIVWLDHRATSEALSIDRYNHPILNTTGGKIWCELSLPKLLWLKNNVTETCWNKAAYFMLLPDFLTWKATQNDSRSIGSALIMCGFKSSPNGKFGWDKVFIDLLGMSELADDNWKRLGSKILKPGEKCGDVTEAAAHELGVASGIPVAGGFVDAYAGILGLIGCNQENNTVEDFSSKLGIICGSSTCLLTISDKEFYLNGMWGPYYEAVVPNKWLIYGGQSATGKLIDHIINTHPAAAKIPKESQSYVQEYLNDLLIRMAEASRLDVDKLTASLHVYPDFHGNRSPLSNELLKGMILGLTLSTRIEDLALLYLATLQSLVYQTKHIMSVMEKGDYPKFKYTSLSGGLAKNRLFVQLHANIIGLPVLLPSESEAVLVGTAIIASTAAKIYPTILEAIRNMTSRVERIEPNSKLIGYHQKKYKIFMDMLDLQKNCLVLMAGEEEPDI